MSTTSREARRRRAAGSSGARQSTPRVMQAGSAGRGLAVAGIEGGAR